MSRPYTNPLLHRGPEHAAYSTLKPISRIRHYLKDLRTHSSTQNEYYSTFVASIPRILHNSDRFKKLLMSWEVAQDELHAVFVHNTTCTNCSSAPWRDMPWRHQNSTKVSKEPARLRADMERFSIWKDMYMAQQEVEVFCVRWAKLENLYLKETQTRTECLGLVGPENPDMRLRW